MRFPQAFLDELRARVSIVDVVGRRVTWDKGKSIPGRGDMWACCPFHGEKTPSFHVREREDHFYCFGCHESGSSIDFVMKLDRLSFPEAVESLAQSVGLPLPERDPAEARRAAKRAELTDVMEAALASFRGALASDEGAEARAYLSGRGLSKDIIDRFELGYAPPGRDRLARQLKADLGVTDAMLAACDLAKESDRGSGLYDRFRERVMFPIRDARGRLVAFGGRAMRDGAGPKYLNSAETELFQKRRTVYNYSSARSAAAQGAPLLIVEGYMDVIGLAQVGVDAAVAPLGTALTEEQLMLVWSAGAEPVAAFDGDQAGLRAARRAADLAATHVAPGRSISFALLPPSCDPDDLARRDGADAIARLVEGATPLVELLWRGAIEGKRFDTPEQRAALEAELDGIAGRVAHEGVQRHYKAAFRERRYQLFRGARAQPHSGGKTARRSAGRWGVAPWEVDGPTDALKAHALAGADRDAAAHRRAARLLRMALRRPDLVERHEEDLVAMSFGSPELDTLRDALISALGEYEEARDGDPRDGFAGIAAQIAGIGVVDRVVALAGSADVTVNSEAEAALFREGLDRAARDARWRQECDGLVVASSEEPSEATAQDDLDPEESDLRRLRLLHEDPSAQQAAQAGDERDVYAQRLRDLVKDQPWIRARKRSSS